MQVLLFELQGCALGDGVVAAAEVVDAVRSHSSCAGCARDGVVVAAVVADAVSAIRAGCARDGVIAAAAVVADATIVAEEIELIQISITFASHTQPITIAVIKRPVHLSKPRLSRLCLGG